jgi:hypothetical protein
MGYAYNKLYKLCYPLYIHVLLTKFSTLITIDEHCLPCLLFYKYGFVIVGEKVPTFVPEESCC